MSKPDRKRTARPRWDVALRSWIEEQFRDWGHVSAQWRWPIIVSMLALALALGSQLPQVEVDTSTRSFLRKNDPARVAYDAFLEQYGSDQLIVVAVRPARVFDPEFLDTLQRLHRELAEEVAHVKEVTSLVNVRETRGDGDELVVRELLDDWPVAGAELERIRERALANPLYRNYVLSEDGRTTTLTVELATYVEGSEAADLLGGFDEDGAASEVRGLSGREEAEAVSGIHAVVDRFRVEGLGVHVAGGPVTSARLTAEMGESMAIFLGLSMLAVGAFLFALFRRAAAVFLPLAVVLLSIVSTFGLMAFLGTPLGIPTQILPSFLLAVGIGGSVHLLVIFFRAFDEGASRADALSHALHHSGLAIVMTGLTTAGGLVSFVVAEIQPVADLGVFAPIGIGLGMLYCMVLLPALLHVLPLKRRPARAVGEPDWIERCLTWLGQRCVSRPKTVLACMSIVLVFALAGVPRLGFSYDPVRWFPAEDPIRAATEFVDEELGGVISLELLLDSGRENGLHDPVLLRRIDAFLAEVEQLEGHGSVRVGKTFSIVDVIKEIHQALNENRAEYYAIPGDRRLVAQELLLFESSGSDALEDVIDPLFQRARLTMKLPYLAPAEYQPYIAEIEALAEQVLGPEIEITITGFVSLMTRALDAISLSLRKSYLIALAIITPLMLMLLGTIRTGVAAMIPNLAPIALTLGLMGWLGLALDTFTLMIGSIAIGLAVDDTIHFMHGFRKYHDELDDTPKAVRQTLHTTGHAILVTSIVLSLSFFVYAFSSLANLSKFGVLTGVTILFAFIADVTLSPALMALSTRGDRRAAARHARLRRAWAERQQRGAARS